MESSDVELCSTCHQPLPRAAKSTPGAGLVPCSRCPASALAMADFIVPGERKEFPLALCRDCYVAWLAENMP